jgi:hypothetical protein
MAHYSFQVDYLIVGSRLVVSVQCLEFFEVLNNAGGKAMLVRPFEYVVSTFADRGGIVSADLRVFLRRPVVIVQHGEGVSVISRRSFRESFLGYLNFELLDLLKWHCDVPENLVSMFFSLPCLLSLSISPERGGMANGFLEA